MAKILITVKCRLLVAHSATLYTMIDQALGVLGQLIFRGKHRSAF